MGAKAIFNVKGQGGGIEGIKVIDTDGVLTMELNGIQILAEQAATITSIGTIASYTPVTFGSTTVTSGNINDLLTTSNALKALRDEVATIATQLNSLLSKLRTHGLIKT